MPVKESWEGAWISGRALQAEAALRSFVRKSKHVQWHLQIRKQEHGFSVGQQWNFRWQVIQMLHFLSLLKRERGWLLKWRDQSCPCGQSCLWITKSSGVQKDYRATGLSEVPMSSGTVWLPLKCFLCNLTTFHLRFPDFERSCSGVPNTFPSVAIHLLLYPAWKKKKTSLLQLSALMICLHFNLYTLNIATKMQVYLNMWDFLITLLCCPIYCVHLWWLVQAGNNERCATSDGGEQRGRGFCTQRNNIHPFKIPLLLSITQGIQKVLNITTLLLAP